MNRLLKIETKMMMNRLLKIKTLQRRNMTVIDFYENKVNFLYCNTSTKCLIEKEYIHTTNLKVYQVSY